jgi:hypothetical protein
VQAPTGSKRGHWRWSGIDEAEKYRFENFNFNEVTFQSKYTFLRPITFKSVPR